ncbi:hypothetical protein BU16DRAFT_323725 [Lophium mytilinum]|uniref:Uncharacterized protein n=1 Tax=Lophium mytilinum TaxID=390894 RepID=A0A6A6R1D2_9PEZI|nr:hypothetical protein BU16DRAFT_323725 [Lophium mytilinum]
MSTSTIITTCEKCGKTCASTGGLLRHWNYCERTEQKKRKREHGDDRSANKTPDGSRHRRNYTTLLDGLNKGNEETNHSNLHTQPTQSHEPKPTKRPPQERPQPTEGRHSGSPLGLSTSKSREYEEDDTLLETTTSFYPFRTAIEHAQVMWWVKTGTSNRAITEWLQDSRIQLMTEPYFYCKSAKDVRRLLLQTRS